MTFIDLAVKALIGYNQFSKEIVQNPQWIFSDAGLKELFNNYQKLPQGTYEYCVDITLQAVTSEQQVGQPVGACTYYTVNDLFLISLITPENDACLRKL